MVSQVTEADRSSLNSGRDRPSPGYLTGSVRVRPMFASDLGAVMRSVGPLVDSLYPNGAALLLRRLEDALAGYAVAHVVATIQMDCPIALAAEAFKGQRARKLSTFWVSPLWRRQGIGTLLIANRIHSWVSSNVDSVHVTVRRDRSRELMALLGPWGFESKATEVNRYGEARDETVLEWRPENLALLRSAAVPALSK